MLQEPPFEFDEVVATYVLDMPLGRRTQLGRRAMAEEIDALRARLEAYPDEG